MRVNRDQGARFCPACGSDAVRRMAVLRGKKRPQSYDRVVCFACRTAFLVKRINQQSELELFPCAICNGPTGLSSGYNGNRCRTCAHAQAEINAAARAANRIRVDKKRAAEKKWDGISVRKAVPRKPRFIVMNPGNERRRFHADLRRAFTNDD